VEKNGPIGLEPPNNAEPIIYETIIGAATKTPSMFPDRQITTSAMQTVMTQNPGRLEISNLLRIHDQIRRRELNGMTRTGLLDLVSVRALPCSDVVGSSVIGYSVIFALAIMLPPFYNLCISVRNPGTLESDFDGGSGR